MINSIIDGICLKLNESFGDGYKIYTEKVEQGLDGHSFIVSCTSPTMNQFLGKRYYKENLFCIHYFPFSDETKNDMNAISELLFSALEYITVDGDLIRGTNMRCEPDDSDVLHFFVNYDLFVYKTDGEEEKMESYDYDGNMKG